MEEKYNSDKIAKHISDILLKKKPEYTEEFEKWVEENKSVGECLEIFSDKETLYSNLNEFRTENKEIGACELMRKIERLKRRRILSVTTAVASAIIVVCFLLWYDAGTPLTSVPTVAFVEPDIVSPTLILSDGEVVLLDGDTVTKQGKIVNSNGTVLINSSDSAETMKWNRLVVPSRNVHSIVLSDGTKVILNANSELEFPEKFGNAERIVTLKGEGYFEVAKDSLRKFIVRNKGLSVEVYGTKFNIDGYSKDHIYTLLLNGSISVAYEGNVAQMLRPMQLANVSTDSGDCVIKDVTDESEYIAWIDGFFSFNGTPLNCVIAEIEAWYGVVLVKPLQMDTNIVITGSFSRKTELSEILQTIEKIAKIKILKIDRI